MPKRRTPQSLLTISKWEIIQNLTLYHTKDLQNLPNELSEDLIDLYDEEFLQTKCENKKEFYLRFENRNKLIKPNMKKLNLIFPHRCKPKFFDETLMMVSKTCKNLTRLSCDFTSQPRFYVLQLVISLVNVIELKLDFGFSVENIKTLQFIDDDILEKIGNTCFQLEILHLTNSSITTQGVRRFCQSNSAGARIKDLNLDDSYVKANGCVTALRNLKQLRRFQCCDHRSNQLVEAFRKLFEDSKESPIPTFQLCEFFEFFLTDDFPTGLLSFVTKCCPNVPELYLTAENNFDRHMKDLKSCNENVRLHLRVGHVENFMENMGYVGCRVTELDLNGCDVHLPTIGFTCPNLTDLSLLEVKYMPVNYVARNNSVVAYSNLLILHLSSRNSVPIPIEQLQFLLHNCLDLQVLKIQFNNEFTDDVMFRILNGVNPLRHLTHFELTDCDTVSSIAILKLLQSDNELTSLTVHSCERIMNNERLQIESVIKENNFRLSLYYSEKVNDEPDEESEDESDDESGDEPDDD